LKPSTSIVRLKAELTSFYADVDKELKRILDNRGITDEEEVKKRCTKIAVDNDQEFYKLDDEKILVVNKTLDNEKNILTFMCIPLE